MEELIHLSRVESLRGTLVELGQSRVWVHLFVNFAKTFFDSSRQDSKKARTISGLCHQRPQPSNAVAVNKADSRRPCQSRLSQPPTDATSSPSTSACSRTSATGSSATTSGAPALAPSAPSSSAIGTPLALFIFSTSLSILILLRAERNVHDPRALAVILEKAEEELARKRHPDPYIRASSQSPSGALSVAYTPFLPSLTQLLHSPVVQSGTWCCLRSVGDSLLTLLSRSVVFLGLLGTRRERNLPVCATSNLFVPLSNGLLVRPPSLRLVPSSITMRTTNIRNPMFSVLSYPHNSKYQRKVNFLLSWDRK